MTKTLLSVTCALLLASVFQSSGATIPAGTVLTVRTLEAVCAIDMPGTAVQARLEYPMIIHGRVILPAGTYFSGEVSTSKRLTMSNTRLTVNLTAVRVGGRDIPVVTTGPQLLSNSIKVGRGRVEVYLADETIAASKRVQFRLARPVVI